MFLSFCGFILKGIKVSQRSKIDEKKILNCYLYESSFYFITFLLVDKKTNIFQQLEITFFLTKNFVEKTNVILVDLTTDSFLRILS